MQAKKNPTLRIGDMEMPIILDETQAPDCLDMVTRDPRTGRIHHVRLERIAPSMAITDKQKDDA